MELFDFERCLRFGALREYCENGESRIAVAKKGHFVHESRLRFGYADPRKMTLIQR